MKRARRASRNEDRSGIDVVIESDVGDLVVQVKSSHAGKACFRERPLISIAIVIARPGDTAEVLLAKVVEGLTPIRAQHLARRAALKAR